MGFAQVGRANASFSLSGTQSQKTPSDKMARPCRASNAEPLSGTLRALCSTNSASLCLSLILSFTAYVYTAFQNSHIIPDLSISRIVLALRSFRVGNDSCVYFPHRSLV